MLFWYVRISLFLSKSISRGNIFNYQVLSPQYIRYIPVTLYRQHQIFLLILWHVLIMLSWIALVWNRISAGGSLLFMRCVSLTLTGLIWAWRRGEASSAILAEFLSDGVTVLCLWQCKSRHLKVCGIFKRTCYFQTNGISYILNWDVRCLCCRWRWFHMLLFWASSSNWPSLNSKTSLTT